MPGRPPSPAASMPESSPIAASPVAAWAVRAFSSAIAAKDSPSSGGSSTPSGSGRRSKPGSSSRISRSLCLLAVAKINGGLPPGDAFLDLAQPRYPHLGEPQQLVERCARERRALGGRLNLDEPTLTGHHHVGIDLGTRVLAVIEVAEGSAGDHADADRRDRAGQRHRLEGPFVQ